MNLKIRPEKEADFPVIHRVVEEAFLGAEHTDHGEQFLVARLRGDPAYRRELALVAENERGIVGYCLFTEIHVGEACELALAPVAVLPEYQGQGIGSALIREGHRIAAALGYRFSVVLGHADYYPRFGYRPAAEYGTKPPFEVPPENYLVCDLSGNGGQLEGVVEYAAAFFES